MQRFRPSSPPITLSAKAIQDLDEKRFMPPKAHRISLQIAKTLGMDQEARRHFERVQQLAKTGKIGIAGQWMPDQGISKQLAVIGVMEQVEPADFARFQTIVVPYCGISARQRRDWQSSEKNIENLTCSQVRRAQVALGLLRMEGAQGLVIGRHDDPESLALAGGHCGSIIQDTSDTARLRFSPAFGVICQTTLSTTRVEWLVQQLRHRWRDARVTFLNTISPTWAAREEALERLLTTCDHALIVGDPGEASCEALAETALRRGKAATIVSGPDQVNASDFREDRKVALTAGAFATDEAIHAVADTLTR
jgi:4-hydroxy-3-methylbut-2-enyl diphosphate reductase IspH